jgi:tetratricopeptide (TPR) repeat protein
MKLVRKYWAIHLVLLLCVALVTSCKTPRREESSMDTRVIFRGSDGRTLTKADLKKIRGTVEYEITGDFVVPDEAKSLHEAARMAGGTGDYKKAIQLLEKASHLAPKWPYPVYDLAYTYLLQNDAENARKYYEKTVELAPRGFFTSITAQDTLTRESKGELPTGTYRAYLSLEWIDAPEKKAKAIRALVKHVPNFAPGWKEMTTLSTKDSEQEDAIDKGLAAHPDSETKGILQINKALILSRRGDKEGAIQMLGEIALNPTSTLATEQMAKVTLLNLTNK